jgi:hypothetical protein
LTGKAGVRVSNRPRIVERKMVVSPKVRGYFVDGLWVRRFCVARDVPYRDDIESVVEKALVRAGRLRQTVPQGYDMLQPAFEGKLVTGLLNGIADGNVFLKAGRL